MNWKKKKQIGTINKESISKGEILSFFVIGEYFSVIAMRRLVIYLGFCWYCKLNSIFFSISMVENGSYVSNAFLLPLMLMRYNTKVVNSVEKSKLCTVHHWHG